LERDVANWRLGVNAKLPSVTASARMNCRGKYFGLDENGREHFNQLRE
jgi:hypothetical protein